jgi:trans-aconitate 2-methyltransferase
VRWDPQQYTRYTDERARPFVDLVGRIAAQAPRRVVDLGCGPGTLTALLAERWPSATVEGIDSSAQMIAAARPGDRVSLRVGDVESWSPPPDADVVVSNATLQWVPTHRELLTSWAPQLPAGGWLAFQVPGNFDAPSHTLMRALTVSRRWAGALTGVLRPDPVGTPGEYAQLLLAAGLQVDVWETTYLHVLSGPDPVLQWVRGTALRPVMAALPPDEYTEFEAQYAEQLREAYPETEHGTVFPFRRIFAVAHRARNHPSSGQ